jgi:branched-chain amino acid transport system ATP-binding protein
VLGQGEPILELRDISKRFGGLVALSEISISVAPGTVHGIIGPNGAGKSTLFNVITGLLRPNSGEILFRGKLLGRIPPHCRVPLGMARTFQNIRLLKDMSVEDNVLIGQHVHTPTPVLSIISGTHLADEWEDKAKKVADACLRKVGLESKKHELARNLSYGQQKLVEFARALAAQPQLILLDEPAAGMNVKEKSELLHMISKLREEKYTVVLIEHDMKLVMNICDQITVLNHGKKIAEGMPRMVRNHPAVIAAYLGKGGDVRAGTC